MRLREKLLKSLHYAQNIQGRKGGFFILRATNATGIVVLSERTLKAVFTALAIFIFIITDFPAGTSPGFREAFASGYSTEIHSKAQWPHDKSDLKPDPAVRFGVLANGFRFALMQNRHPKGRVSMHLNIQAGSMHENEGQQGVAHFVEHMLFYGTTHFDPGELEKYFQSLGMRFGPDANAHTGFFETVYDIFLPGGDLESIEKGLVVMSDFAGGALLPAYEVNRERKVVLSEKRTRDSASYREFAAKMKFEFPHSKLSRRLPLGSDEVIQQADRKLLKQFYEAWYRPKKMILVMVGDFDIETAVSLIEKRLSMLKPANTDLPEPDIGAVSHKGLKVFYHFDKEKGATSVSIKVIDAIDKKPDTVSSQKDRLLKRMANRIVQNRLKVAFRKPGAPFTSASIQASIGWQQVAIAEIKAFCNPENWEKSLAHIEQTLRQGLEYGFTDAEIERVKADFLAKLDLAVKRSDSRKSKAIARSIIRKLNGNRVFQSPGQRKSLLGPFISSFSQKDVHEAFREIWAPGHRLVQLSGNIDLRGDNDDYEKKIRAAYLKSTRVKVENPLEVEAEQFPYLSEPDRNGKIVRKNIIPDLGISQFDFENGLRLNLKQTEFEPNSISFCLAFGPGISGEPADRPGLSKISRRVINESGFGRLTKDQVERALAGKSTRVWFGMDDVRFFFKGKTIPSELPLMFQILHTHLVDPGLRDEAFKVSMKRFVQRRRRLTYSVMGAMALFGRRFLAGGDTRFGMPSDVEFEKLSLKDVRSWFAGSLREGGIELSIVGDFNADIVVPLASKYLGTLPPKKKASLPQRRTPVFPSGQFLEKNVHTKIPQSLVVVAYPTEDFWDIHRTRRLSVLSDVFSARLRLKVREKLGMSYSPVAYNRSSKSYSKYGVLQAVIQTAPETTARVEQEIKKEAQKLAQNGITPAELERVLKPKLTAIKDVLLTNQYWLDSVLKGSAPFPQQIGWSRSMQKDFASITANEISALAARYLDNDKAATILINPVP